MKSRELLKSCRFVRTIVFGVSEILVWLSERKRFLSEAEHRFSSNCLQNGTFKDYKKAFWRHRVTYAEYMYSYEYWHLNEQERDEFISTSEMQVIYRKLGDRNVREVFHDKVRFLTAFKPFVYRWWALANTLSFEQFMTKAMEFDIIAKPVDGTRGDGILKIKGTEERNWQQLHDQLVDGNYLLEQCITSCDELSSFHPSSLNTIRVVTISNGDKCEIFGALFRMGAHGSIIDNTHAGGVYAPINVKTGVIDVSAIDAQNNHYECHPDTGKPIKGFLIPDWERVISTCKEATRTIPNIRFAGWDLCVNHDGEVEIIEGNHAPDFDGGMQAPMKVGVKKKLQQTVIDVLGVDPVPLISVWR